MSSFYLYRKQNGYGCDYTIGCAQACTELYATSKDKAIKEVIDDYDSDGLEVMIILEVNEEIDMLPIFEAKMEEENQARKQRAQAAKEASEKAEYERLKAKYE